MNSGSEFQITDRSYVNLTLNVYNCGNRDIQLEDTVGTDYYVFYYIKEGSGVVTQEKFTKKIEEGQLLVIFPGVDASIRSAHRKPMNVSWIAFSGYLVDRYLMRAKISTYDPLFEDSPDRQLEHMMDMLVHAATRQINRYCPIVAQLYGIFGFLLDHSGMDSKIDIALPENVLGKALDYVDRHYQTAITVENIAEGIGTNRKTLYSIFKKMTGFSTREYLIYYRMGKAAKLLMTNQEPIENVAMSVGYRDQFHFSKEFKKNVGFPPSEYRRIVSADPAKEYISPVRFVREKFPEVCADGRMNENRPPYSI